MTRIMSHILLVNAKEQIEYSFDGPGDLYRRMLKKLQTKDFGLNFQNNKKFWDLHLQSARYEQYKVPYFPIFKLKNLEN